MLWIALTTGSLAIVLLSEQLKNKKVEWIFKPLASTGFLGLSLESGALESDIGRIFFCALVLSWLGDVLLIPRTPKPFLAGLIAFLLGHIAFVAAFVVSGPSWTTATLCLIPLTAISVGVGWWMVPKAPEKMRVPVVAYTGVITLMVATAGGLWDHQFGHYILLAAFVFYLSDLSVAINRFVSPAFIHRLWGLPLYYGAQLTFAWLSGRVV